MTLTSRTRATVRSVTRSTPEVKGRATAAFDTAVVMGSVKSPGSAVVVNGGVGIRSQSTMDASAAVRGGTMRQIDAGAGVRGGMVQDVWDAGVGSVSSRGETGVAERSGAAVRSVVSPGSAMAANRVAIGSQTRLAVPVWLSALAVKRRVACVSVSSRNETGAAERSVVSPGSAVVIAGCAAMEFQTRLVVRSAWLSALVVQRRVACVSVPSRDGAGAAVRSEVSPGSAVVVADRAAIGSQTRLAVWSAWLSALVAKGGAACVSVPSRDETGAAVRSVSSCEFSCSQWQIVPSSESRHSTSCLFLRNRGDLRRQDPSGLPSENRAAARASTVAVLQALFSQWLSFFVSTPEALPRGSSTSRLPPHPACSVVGVPDLDLVRGG